MWMPSFLAKFTTPPLLLCYSVFNLLVSQFALLHPSKNGTRPFLWRSKGTGIVVKKLFLCIFCSGVSFFFAFVATLS